MKEPSPEKEDDTRPNADEEQLMSALHKETNSEAAIKMSEDQSAVKEREAEVRDRQEKDSVETPKQEDGEITIIHEVLHMKQNTADGNIFQAESKSSEQALSAQLKCLQTEDSIQETTSPVQEHIQIQSVEESLNPAVTSTITQITECWDEYAAPTADDMHDGASSSELVFSSLCSNAQDQLNFCGQHNAQAGWHFPVGPGLAEEVQCPLWQFPTLSYYPPVEQTLTFEGENLISFLRRIFLVWVFSVIISIVEEFL